MKPLVLFRCPSCAKVLGSIDEYPTDWTGSVRIDVCVKHTPDAARPLNDERSRQRFYRRAIKQWGDRGYLITVAHEVKLVAVRSAIEKARGRGKTVSVTIHPPQRETR